MTTDEHIVRIMTIMAVFAFIGAVIYLADRIDKMDARITNIEMAK